MFWENCEAVRGHRSESRKSFRIQRPPLVANVVDCTFSVSFGGLRGLLSFSGGSLEFLGVPCAERGAGDGGGEDKLDVLALQEYENLLHNNNRRSDMSMA